MMPAGTALPAATRATPPAPGWGPGMTLLLGAVVFFAYATFQGIAMIPLIILEHTGPGGAGPRVPVALAISGFNLAVGTAAGCPAMLLLCAGVILARRGPSIASHLALQPIPLHRLLGWILLMEALAFSFSGLNDLLHRPAPEFVTSAYATARHLPFFWAAIALCAPVAEEVLFRGFLFPGLLESRLRAPGTILLTSLIFALVHAGQYDWVDLLQVGTVGILLGIARVRSGTLLAPLAMHVALNLTSLTLFALHLAE